MDSDTVSRIKEILVDNWENAFFVKETSSEVDIFVELENTSLDTGLWNVIPMCIDGKYIKIFKVPAGYIDGLVRDSSKT